MPESKVVGRRSSLWRGTHPLVLAFIFVIAPLCVILAVRFLIGLRHVRFGVIADDYFLQVGASLIGIVMGPVAIGVLQWRRRAYVIASACPVCGVEATRDFGDLKRESPWPIPCGQCTAYLHLNGRALECAK